MLPKKKRALTLAGGGPAVGISVGFLKALEEFPDVTFDVWSLSCVGAWLGCIYHVSPDRARKLAYVESVMRNFFRPDDVYDKFPCPTVFLPDFPEWLGASLKFMVDPNSYQNLVVPDEINAAYRRLLDFYLAPSKWNRGDSCNLVLNTLMAPNPLARFLMSLMYKSELPGMNKLWFGPDYSLLKNFDMSLLQLDDVPILYHNAYNIDAQRLELFSNKDPRYHEITTKTLCACSGLPYILSPVDIDGTTYVEGATVDTVGFWDLLQNHPDLDEIWVSRILDRRQVRPHRNLLEALNNLVMLFAATTSEDDVKLFRFHLRDENARRAEKARDEGTTPHLIKLMEIPVDPNTNYNWTHSNLESSIHYSYHAARLVLRQYQGSLSMAG
jgi:predicted acylesterase/phospholipase RssA